MSELTAKPIGKTFTLDDGEGRGPLSIARLRFHPTARVLFGQCADRRLGAWDLDAAPRPSRSGESVAGRFVSPHDAGWIRGFDIHPRGASVATGGSDRRLKLWPLDGGAPAERPTHDVAGHEGWIEGVAFSPDGNTLATIGADRRLKLWSAASLRLVKDEPAHSKPPRDLTFSADGRWIVTGGEDGVAIVWNAATLEVVRRIETGMTNDQQGQNPGYSGILRLSLSRDSRWLALGLDRLSLIFETATGHGVASIAQAGFDVAFGRRLDILATGENTIKLTAYDPASFRPAPVALRRDPRGNTLPVSLPPLAGREILQHNRGEFSVGVAFSSDDATLAAGKSSGQVSVWTVQA
jgi:WD40 repeat protein